MLDIQSIMQFTIRVVAVWLACAQVAQAGEVVYERDVKPLLQARCYTCHGALKQQSGLRLDTVTSMLRGGDSGPAVAKGDAPKSLILARVTATDISERMPPEQEGEPLTAAQIATLRAWIEGGAIGPADEQPEADPRDHWSFRTIARPKLPSVRSGDWVQNPIDQFAARDHERLGLTPQAEASRLLLLRRLSLDLIGLPPTAAEIAQCESDPSPDWYQRIVDRLLEDPRHGERWARHWMDVWRYSDWWGLGDQLRNSQKHIWHWRDWIVESLNDDMPYDEMVRMMLAGDELAPNDLDKLRATGYLARNYFLFNRNPWMDETVEHVAKGFLGLTMNCAKCHDHKYDPITQADYYGMRAFFEPYHVRLDLLPGETDLVRDGLPRAFDGLLDLPTYRFIRGNENNPDKSSAIPPGIPDVLEFEPLKIEPVELPVEAWQPERRAWVVEGHRSAARGRLAAAEEKLKAAREAFVVTEHDKEANALDESLRDLHLAELALAVAKADVRSVDERAAAMQLLWKPSKEEKGVTEGAPTEATRAANRAAARAERELPVAQTRLTLAEAEARLQRAEMDKRAGIEKQVATARESLDKALKQVEETTEQYIRLTGAEWTPTRFFNSAKDDPAVTFPARSSGRRKALAQWITDRRNPLTARVAVNHLWMHHFGTPLVSTFVDFGRKGNPPANPELLDWLAAELIDSGWSMKHLHRLIVQSATYRLSSSADVDANLEKLGKHANLANIEKDPDNRYLWRRTPSRLESQAVRDSILALAGTLDLMHGGPSVPIAQQTESTRRSLYFFHSNNERNLFLTTFDEADVNECYRREQSIVPQQALALTNSQLVLEALPAIAKQLERELVARGTSIADDAAFIRLAFVVLLGNEPSEAELALSAQSLDAWKKLPVSTGSESINASPRTNLIWVLLNHNDFVTLR
jgi:hypothetical protein